LKGYIVGIIDGRDMIYTDEMLSCDMIFLPSSMKIGTGVRTILRFNLNNLNVCNVGITGGIEL
jgi:hypothetical protein